MSDQSISDNPVSTSGLGFAHSGYMYQDLVTAYFMAQALIDRFDLVVDKKSFGGDIFDDLRIGGIRRMQLKSSLTSSDPFELEDLSTKRRQCRIDELLSAAKEDGFSSPEYRLSATWSRPVGSSLEGILTPVSGDLSFQGQSSILFRLEAEPLISASALFQLDDEPLDSGIATKLAQHLTDFSEVDIRAFCDRFRLELECPKASLDLDAPGPLESILLDTLQSRIGIGAFPNQQLRLVDTAAHLVYAANLARAQQKLVRPADTVQRLRLRTDFGRIAQKFPVNSSYLVERENVFNNLVSFVSSRSISIVIGEPGAGKSWLLTQLTDQLNQSGTAAIRHYCYLEPTDREVQLRVTARVMFGNLTAELLDVKPSLKPDTAPLFAATPRTFESLLNNLSPDDELYVVVDGIDHISRVAYQSTSLATGDVDIVDQIALLKLPPNVHLIIGSQPGLHLQPLQTPENVFPLPAWQTKDVEALIEKIGLSEILLKSGHGDQIAEVVKQIDLRSEGNPLYATYITREIRLRVEQGEGILLTSLIDQIPFRLGDLRHYYDYLFDRISHHQAVSVAESLALLDFGVSRADLAEIYPADAHRLPQALAVLRPILERASAQGGFRIYHESFRRFVVDKLIAAGASVSSRLQPVCEWLERRGFFKDSKAYRFLIPTLRRAGRDAEVLGRVTPSFMQDSLHEGHPSIAIAYNLVVAAEVAASHQDWRMLARINEIQRANATYVSERIGDVAMYGMAFAELRGAGTLNERLLFEDRQTFAHEPGLLLCEVCDRAGVVPPWREYMRLPASGLGNSFSQAQVTLAFFRGIARVHGRDEAVGLLVEWSYAFPDRTDLLYGAIERLKSVFGDDILDVLLSLLVSPTLRVALLSEALRRAKAMKEQSRFDVYAQELLAIAPDLATRAQVVKLGASPSSAIPFPPPATYALDDIYAHRYQSNLADWMAALAISARTPEISIATEQQRMRGVGWYRYWLQYIVAITEAEALFDRDRVAGKSAALKAFDLLIEDTRRFMGSPRACDLYPLHSVIFDSIRSGLDLLDEDPVAFQEVLPKLVKISDDTTSSLQNEESGPLDTEALFNVLRDFVERPALTDLILPVLQTQRTDRVENRGYYTALSVQELQLCHTYSRLCRPAEAEAHWDRACLFLSAYGHRKDITLGEILEGQIAISKVQGPAASDLPELTQPLIYEVIAHTDGKGTRHFPVDWFEGLAHSRPIHAALLLAHEFAQRDGVVDWRFENSFESLLSILSGSADPLTLSFLWSALFPDRPSSTVDTRIHTLDRLRAIDARLSNESSLRLAAEIEGDSDSAHALDIKKVRAKIKENGGPPPAQGDVFVITPEKNEHSVFGREKRPGDIATPIFPVGGTPFTLLADIRKIGLSRETPVDELVNAVGYRMIELAESSNGETEIEILLKQVAKDSVLSSNVDSVYSGLAEGFARYGYKGLAALSYTLAFTRTRGAGGWLSFGDEEHSHLFRTALEFDRTVAYKTLSEEVLSKIDGDSYEPGLTQHLTALFANIGEILTARAVWRGALEVVEKRLPRTSNTYAPFDRYQAQNADQITLDAALCLLLLSRLVHPDQRRKRAAVAGSAYLLRHRPESFVVAAKLFLERDYSFTANLALLKLIERFEAAPYSVSQGLSNLLAAFAVGPEFGNCEIARGLLARSGSTQSFDTRLRTVLSSRVLSSQAIQRVLSIDPADRAENLAELWSNFPSLLAVSFENEWETNPRHKAIEKRRMEVVEESSGRRFPSPPILMWHEELFELSMHRLLNSLDVHLWKIGSPDPSLLREVCDAVSPDIEMHVRRWLSRIPRPNLFLPSKQQQDFAPLGPLSTNDDAAGWVRIAYYEREHVLASDGSVSKTLNVSAAFEVPRLGDPEPPTMPFGYGELGHWKTVDSPLPPFRAGPTVGFVLLEDYLGKLPLLTLSPRATSRLEIKIGDRLSHLEFLDASDTPCIRFRHWHVRPFGDRLSRSADRASGCDLVVRTDVWEKICNLFANGAPIPRTYRSEKQAVG